MVNSDIIITNPAQLLLAGSLVDTRTDAPNVIINGRIEVEFNNDNLSADERTRTINILDKIATVIDNGVLLTNTASPTSQISLANLSFIDGDFTVNGAEASVTKLLTINGDLVVNHGGAVTYPELTTIGNDLIINTGVLGNITSVDLTGVNIGGDLVANATNEINLPKATAANFGTSEVSTATLAIATDVDFGHTGTLSSLYVNAPKSVTLDIASNSVTGAFDIADVDATAVINVPNATLIGQTYIDDSASASLNKLTAIDGSATIKSKAVTIPELSSSVSGTLTFTEAITLNFPKLSLGGMLDGQKAETITLLSGLDTYLTTTDKAKSITLLTQGNTTNFNAASQTILESLNVIGKENNEATAVSVTSLITAQGTKLKNNHYWRNHRLGPCRRPWSNLGYNPREHSWISH